MKLWTKHVERNVFHIKGNCYLIPHLQFWVIMWKSICNYSSEFIWRFQNSTDNSGMERWKLWDNIVSWWSIIVPDGNRIRRSSVFFGRKDVGWCQDCIIFQTRLKVSELRFYTPSFWLWDVPPQPGARGTPSKVSFLNCADQMKYHNKWLSVTRVWKILIY